MLPLWKQCFISLPPIGGAYQFDLHSLFISVQKHAVIIERLA